MPSRPFNDIEQQGRALVERRGGHWTAGKGGLCRCPAHDDRRPSLSVRIGQRGLLLHCFAGCESRRVIAALRELGADFPPSTAPGEAGTHEVGGAIAAAALRLWREAKPIEGSPADRYLSGRGLVALGDDLRFHPRTPQGVWPFTVFRPALIAAVRDETGLVAIHRTFLGPPGADGGARRMGLGSFGSGVVRLGGTARRLGLAEGIETALSATALFGIPCWATLGTERFARVALPPEVEAITLFLDNDAGGRRAEALARAAFAGLPVVVRYPRGRGADWNDVLLARRPSRTWRGEGAGAG